MKKSAFWDGFEKSAKKKEEDEDKKGKRDPTEMGARALTGFLAGQASGFASLPIAPFAMLAHSKSEKFTPAQAKAFADKVMKARGLQTGLQVGGVPFDLMSHYDPNLDVARVGGKPSAAILAHELGHADSAGKMWRRGGLGKAYVRGSAISGKLLAPYAPGIALMTNTELGDKIAPYAGLMGAAPMLLEEATASGKAMRDLKRFQGTKSMLKSMPFLGLALGTYAAGPAFTGYMAKRLVDKKKKEREEKKQEWVRRQEGWLTVDILLEDTMGDFWQGFEKRSYDYAHESGELKSHYKSRSKDTPRTKTKSGLIGAGIGGVGGAMLGGLHGMESGSPLAGMALGGLLGAAGGGLMGVISAITDKLGIERAKLIVAMPPKEQEDYLKHLARQNEISESDRNAWYRELRKDRREEGRHEEMMGELRRRR